MIFPIWVTFFQSTPFNWHIFIYQNKLLVEQRIEEKIKKGPREEAVSDGLYYEGDSWLKQFGNIQMIQWFN